MNEVNPGPALPPDDRSRMSLRSSGLRLLRSLLVGQRRQHLGGAAQLVVVELGELDVDSLQEPALVSAALAAACMS
jgi:hypothetical protein